MATMTGKRARKTGGNRYDCKKRNRKRNQAKVERWRQQEAERRRSAKHTAAV